MYSSVEENIRREAAEVGCYGLVEGWAKNLFTHKKYYAFTSTKNDGPFYCAACYSDAIIRKCTEKKDHFAHKARLSPVIGPKDRELHERCQKEICESLIKRFPDGKWALDRPIPENKKFDIPKLVPDISGRINGVRVVIEVQASLLTIPKIVKRSDGYNKRKIAILWIVPLREPLGFKPFRPRLYERYLHSIYYGRTYYWTQGQGLALTPIHYGVASRWIEYSEWYDENGDYQQAGGYYKAYRIVKKPMYGNEVNIIDDFIEHPRPTFTPDNEKKSVPQCLIWRDKQKVWWNPKEEAKLRQDIEYNVLDNQPFNKKPRVAS